ncbi:TetR/AcrR family transcriptional regulator [Bacillus sp. BRMEA1]|uniref:TetR/AcrR family transcriptional regulator n=1 Tax=Neobacillus endophyticus TaxID=2738405 RepID=UPI00156379B3|nr:TetR/AcrR family transcriptional regulator [Neobacillus endophyticus]NRD79980.1 TetR/AcrR family transcriptional regulator [Neobacillus endophyticus]
MVNDENTPPTRAERRDAAKNRQLILHTAHKLFEQYGVEQVSMNQIATEAQIGPGTLYRRYRNKSELCLDLIKDSVDLFFEDIEVYLEENKTVPPNQKLKEIISLFIGFREKKAQLLTGVEETMSSNPLKSRIQSPIYVELHQILVGLFDEMTVKVQTTHSLNVFKADMVLMALSRDFYSFQKDVRNYSPEEILELVYSTFIFN